MCISLHQLSLTWIFHSSVSAYSLKIGTLCMIGNAWSSYEIFYIVLELLPSWSAKNVFMMSSPFLSSGRPLVSYHAGKWMNGPVKHCFDRPWSTFQLGIWWTLQMVTVSAVLGVPPFISQLQGYTGCKHCGCLLCLVIILINITFTTWAVFIQNCC